MEKETINKTKTQTPEWEEIFANNAANKGFISKIQKQLIQLSIKGKKKPNQKLDRRSK